MTAGSEDNRQPAAADASAAPLFDRIFFVILVGVLCARLLIPESLYRVAFSFLPEATPAGTTAATSVWLDGILLVAAVLVMLFRCRLRVRIGAAHVALGLLLLSVVISLTAAHDKRLAANAGAELVVLAGAGFALTRVLRARWMVHLLLAALLASGTTNAVKCTTQRAYEFDDSLQYWEEHKAERIASDVDSNSPTLIDYERRLRSVEAFGYLSHPNVTGSCLAMCLLITGGMLAGAWRLPAGQPSRKAAVALVAGALAMALFVGLWLTGSAGALVAAACGGILLVALGLGRVWVAQHLRTTFALLAALYVGVIATGAAYGWLRGTLPSTSLAFRWQYWQAGACAFRHSPLTGIGRENFRGAYLLYKAPESTEEVTNAHDLWLSLLVELGPLGLAAGILLIGLATYAAVRGLAETDDHPPVGPRIGAAIAVALSVLVIQAVFSGEPFAAPGIPLLWATLVAGVWLLAFLSSYSVIAQVDEHVATAVWLSLGVLAAVSAVLIHNLIGFSLLTPAGLSLFVCLAAAGFAPTRRRRTPHACDVPSVKSHNVMRTAISATLAAGTIGVYLWAVAIPTLRAEALLQDALATMQRRPTLAALRAALDRHGGLQVDNWDAELPRRIAQLALAAGKGSQPASRQWLSDLHAAEEYARVAWERNPNSYASARLRAEILELRAANSSSSQAWNAAAAAWETAADLYPTDPRTRINAGNAWFELWKRSQEPTHAQAAERHLEAALAIDATRPAEVAAKLRPGELATVRQRLRALRGVDRPQLP